MSELTTLFQNTADAIRSKTGDTATMQASQFPAKIRGISVGISQDEADARYLQLSGGTMTGDLKVKESPASASSAVSKSYAQGLFASALPKSGGTMTGDLILNGAPTADNQAATKAYVDGKSAGLSVVLLWENSNVKATFPTQAITISPPDGTKFLFFMFNHSTTEGLCSTLLTLYNFDKWYYVQTVASNYKLGYRKVHVLTDNSINFSPGVVCYNYSETTPDAGICIPVKIYAIL